ncbi:MAG: alanine racemase [Coriobacteriales bacterium]|jgi:alanine racemase|nr:alanine racemase [Coriobacteriales bacterium]
MDPQRSLDGGVVQQNREYAAPERRWAWVEIDREAIRHNLKRFRRHLGPDVRMLAVVKADGYGHGAVECARVSLATGASVLGVASVDEGIELRHAGIAAPVLILAEPPIEAIPLVLQHQLVPSVYNMEFALALGETADAQGRPSPYHLKVDTGMNRVGVHYSDAGDFLRTIDFHRGLELQGVFTHFATADDIDTYEFKRQIERFEQALSVIRYMGIDPGTVHAANTSAAIRYRQSHYDMVRLGIGIYGLYPSEVTKQSIELHPAMSVRARVSFLKAVPVGEGVSYSHSYRSPGNVLVATLPIGYGDGLSRVLSNRMDVLAKGRRLPQVGNICMDMTMVEVDQRSSALHPRTDIALGDEVTIIGRSGNDLITLDDMGKMTGTINYELACRFGLRLDRVFVD